MKVLGLSLATILSFVVASIASAQTVTQDEAIAPNVG